MHDLPPREVPLEAVLGSLQQGVTVWDDGLRLLFWNRAYTAMYGIPAKAFRRGMPLAELARV
ncbi:MAG: PAS-domain containing protein, partial [Rhizobiales bacterium]|nr:PAS-domain containing protein [Hyphomicrobiales bacterium]